jgi:hypothetical protein
MIVVLGELGGEDEYSLVEALQAGKVRCAAVAGWWLVVVERRLWGELWRGRVV